MKEVVKKLFTTYLPLMAKSLVTNVKEEMDNNPDSMNRPFWMSGRFIGTIMTLVCGSYAAKVGYNLNASIETATELVELVYNNKALLVSVCAMMAGIGRGLLGLIQRVKQ